MEHEWRYCPNCAQPLQQIVQMEDGGEKSRLRCASCSWTHWNNPTPVLAAVVEYEGRILLARNAAWQGRSFALITGCMEAGETPEEGITREVLEETALTVDAVKLIGVWDFQRMNQVIIAYHVVARGQIRLSPELAEYKLFAPGDIVCWPAGTGYAVAKWLESRGITPRFKTPEERAALATPRADAS